MLKDSDHQSFFINGSENGKVSSLFLELEDFIFALSIDMLQSFILAQLLDGHVQMVKSSQISSLFFKLEGFIFTLSIDMLENFILALLLAVTSGEREVSRAWLSYDWCLAAPKVARLEIVHIWKKLHCLVEDVLLRVLALISKAEGYRCLRKRSKIRKAKRFEVRIKRS